MKTHSPQYISLFRKLGTVAADDKTFARYYDNCVRELANKARLVQTLPWFNTNVEMHLGVALNLDALELTREQHRRFKREFGFTKSSHQLNTNLTPTSHQVNTNLTPTSHQLNTKTWVEVAETQAVREPLSKSSKSNKSSKGPASQATEHATGASAAGCGKPPVASHDERPGSLRSPADSKATFDDAQAYATGNDAQAYSNAASLWCDKKPYLGVGEVDIATDKYWVRMQPTKDYHKVVVGGDEFKADIRRHCIAMMESGVKTAVSAVYADRGRKQPIANAFAATEYDTSGRPVSISVLVNGAVCLIALAPYHNDNAANPPQFKTPREAN